MTNTLRPLTVGELLDRTFFLYRRHFLLFVGIAALPNLIILSFQLFQLVVAPMSLGGALMTLAWLLVTIIVYFVTIAISQGATIIAVSQIQLEREATASGAFAAIRPRIGEIALVILGMGLRILVGFLFFVVPGVYLAIVWSLTIPVVVLEGRGLSAALARSAELTKGHRGRVFIIYFLLLVLVYVVTILVQIPLMTAIAITSGSISAGELPPSAEIILALSNFVMTSLVSPIVTIALSLVYYDERVRKEAFDLHHMLEEIDRSATPSPAA
jgi:membrane-anchored glycerophosphoryl diester phosphodiesterase (GDPDase)